MEDKVLLKLASGSAFLAVPTLLLSGAFLALFFSGRGEHYGRLNDIFVAISLVLLILPAIGVYSLTRELNGPWLDVIIWFGVAGMAIAAGGQMLLVLGVISLQTSFVTGGLGILPVLAWMISLAVLSLALAQLPESIGWTTGIVLVLSLLVTLAWTLHRKVGAWSLAAALNVTLVVWLGSLGWFLQGAT